MKWFTSVFGNLSDEAFCLLVGTLKTGCAMLVCSLLLLVGIGAGLLLMNQHDKVVYTDNYYRTETGTKYHLRDCMYIKDKTDVYRLTREEFESGEYEPCGACIPGGTTDD